MLKQKLTNHKFYNKWLYKVSLSVPGVSIFRMKTYDELPQMLAGSPGYNRFVSDTVHKAYANKDNVLKLSNYLNKLVGEYAKRIERDTIDLYTNDKEIYDSIIENFQNLVRSCYKPRDHLLNELDSNKYIICKKLPHNLYKFKVFLLPHKLKSNKEEKAKYLDWLGNQPAVYISYSTKKWFMNTDWYWDRRYLYVQDEHSLLLLQMRNPNVLGRVYEYLVSDK